MPRCRVLRNCRSTHEYRVSCCRHEVLGPKRRLLLHPCLHAALARRNSTLVSAAPLSLFRLLPDFHGACRHPSFRLLGHVASPIRITASASPCCVMRSTKQGISSSLACSPGAAAAQGTPPHQVQRHITTAAVSSSTARTSDMAKSKRLSFGMVGSPPTSLLHVHRNAVRHQPQMPSKRIVGERVAQTRAARATSDSLAPRGLGCA